MDKKWADFRRKNFAVVESILARHEGFGDDAERQYAPDLQEDAFEIDTTISMRYFLLLNGVAPEARTVCEPSDMRRILKHSAPEVDPGQTGPISIVLIL